MHCTDFFMHTHTHSASPHTRSLTHAHRLWAVVCLWHLNHPHPLRTIQFSYKIMTIRQIEHSDVYTRFVIGAEYGMHAGRKYGKRSEQGKMHGKIVNWCPPDVGNGVNGVANEIVKTSNNKRLSHSPATPCRMMRTADKFPLPSVTRFAVSFIFVLFKKIMFTFYSRRCLFVLPLWPAEYMNVIHCVLGGFFFSLSLSLVSGSILVVVGHASFVAMCRFHTRRPFVIRSFHLLCDSLGIFLSARASCADDRAQCFRLSQEEKSKQTSSSHSADVWTVVHYNGRQKRTDNRNWMGNATRVCVCTLFG